MQQRMGQMSLQEEVGGGREDERGREGGREGYCLVCLELLRLVSPRAFDFPFAFS